MSRQLTLFDLERIAPAIPVDTTLPPVRVLLTYHGRLQYRLASYRGGPDWACVIWARTPFPTAFSLEWELKWGTPAPWYVLADGDRIFDPPIPVTEFQPDGS